MPDYSLGRVVDVPLRLVFRAVSLNKIKVMRTRIFIRLAVLAAVTAITLGCSKTPASIKGLPSRFARMDSVNIHYKECGSGGNAVVFVHGFGCDMNSWERQYEGLKGEKGLRMIFIDLPGFGGSSKPRVEYTLQFFADAVNAVMAAERLDSAVFVGHSLGTPVCRQVLLTGGKGALCDIDGVYCFYSEPVSPEYEAAIEAFASSFEGDACRANIEGFVTSLAGPDTPATITEYAMSTMPLTPEYVASSTMRNLVDRKWWTGEPILAPVRIICTQNSGLDPDNKEKMTALYPRMDYIELTTCGHFIQMEQPELVNEQILDLLPD